MCLPLYPRGGQGGRAVKSRVLRDWLRVGFIGATVSLVVATGSSAVGRATVGARPASTGGAVSLLGHSDLGGQGANGSVAVVGHTAIVGAGFLASSAAHASFYNPMNCPPATVKVVDISDPTNPTVASMIPLKPGVAALDVAAIHVSTPSFTGDLAAVAMAACNSTAFSFNRGVEYYNVTLPRHPHFLGRYLADVDPTGPLCAASAGGNCASSQHEVSLVQRPDGRVLSLSTEPFASASGFPSGDLRVVDVTDPTHPVEVGSFPPSADAFSDNGCRPFNAGHSAQPSADGTQALLAFLDQGVYNLNLSNPSAPSVIGQFIYPNSKAVEGNAGYATYAGTTRPLALVSEEDWIAPDSSLIVSAPGAAGVKRTCEAMFTLFDPNNTAQVYRHLGSHISGEIAYLGRGCPQSPGSPGPDPYLSDPAGKIALIDRSGHGFPNFCSFSDKVLRAQAAGAIGVVFAQTAMAPIFSPDGVPTGITIPAEMMGRVDSDAVRAAACPSIVGGVCSAHRPVHATMVDRPGQWGALRVVDLSNPAAPKAIGSYQTTNSRRFPPPDLGVYAPSRAVAAGDVAYVAWNSDGLQVLDVSSTPRLIGSFVPPDTPDPTGTIPAKAYVQGVALAGCGEVVITDVNSGLYVLSVPAPAHCVASASQAAGSAPAHTSGSAAPLLHAPRRALIGDPLSLPTTGF